MSDTSGSSGRIKMGKVRIGINGYGVIGKRIADAVVLQDDMELVGVTVRTPDYRLFPALKAKIPVFAVDNESKEKLINSGFKVQGVLADLLGTVDMIVDATPAGVGKENKKKYDAARVKSIFQGGEEHELTGLSFVAEANYEKAIGKESVRVVSCNTTAIVRIINSFLSHRLLEKAYIALARRGVDPVESHAKGPVGTVVLEEKIPSHQALDAKTVVPELDALTLAFAVPTTLGHLHAAFLRLKQKLTKEDVVEILKMSTRVVPIKYKDGVTAENQLVELMRDMGRTRADMWEVAFWEDSLYVGGEDVAFYYQVHNEAIVVPENIDAIRALTGIERDPKASIAKTNSSLGIVTNFNV